VTSITLILTVIDENCFLPRRSEQLRVDRGRPVNTYSNQTHPDRSIRGRNRFRSYVSQRPTLKRILLPLVECSEMALNIVGRRFPSLIKPRTGNISLAITSQCNLRCLGCRYGRDFMPGARLDLTSVKNLIDDAAALGIRWIRFYGGEPLVHTDLGSMISYATNRGVHSWISTNAALLNSPRFHELRRAGLHGVAIGLYGVNEEYDWYVQKKGAFETLEHNLKELRKGPGQDFDLHFSWLLAAHTCKVDALRGAWSLAERFNAHFHVDIVHEGGSLPYFTDGPHGCLRLDASCRQLEEVVTELLRLRRSSPIRYREPIASIRAIPDWVGTGRQMDVPCDMYKHIWIGPDGSVKLCYSGFALGNINVCSLRDILYTADHAAAARSAFLLRCPKCHCNRDIRIKRDLEARVRYGWS
jgi:MoaA/NifB/PqqE/SkfB family radical SAM enzyme